MPVQLSGDAFDLVAAVAADENRVFVQRTLRTLSHDARWTDQIVDQVGSGRLELRGVLSWLAREMRPRRYLEVGVRRGFSMSVVAARCPDVDIVGFDLWIPGYAAADNPGPAFVRSELRCLRHTGQVHLISGNSHRTLPAYFGMRNAPLRERIALWTRRVPRWTAFDLITVDGDHSLLGAYQDLVDVMPRCVVGGVVVFDDLAPDAARISRQALAAERGPDPHRWGDLLGVWHAVQARFPEFRYVEYTAHPPGVGLAVRLR